MSNKYTKMQQAQYDFDASHWSLDNRDPVVGSFDQHNAWKDYDDFLFKGVKTKGKVALEFGCGPGRNIVKFANKFERIDGVDLAQANLDNAKKWLAHNNIDVPNLFKNNGTDLSDIPDESYDVIFSTITLQHICVHTIRKSLMAEFFRVLKPGGYLCFQMGFGVGKPETVDYDADFYDAISTNSGMDVRVESSDQLKEDLELLGFSKFKFDIRPVGPGDRHPNWIFVRVKK